MLKSELKSGMLIVKEGGSMGIVMLNTPQGNCIVGTGANDTGETWFPMVELEEDLSNHIPGGSYNVMKVYGYPSNRRAASMSTLERKLIWEKSLNQIKLGDYTGTIEGSKLKIAGGEVPKAQLKKLLDKIRSFKAGKMPKRAGNTINHMAYEALVDNGMCIGSKVKIVGTHLGHCNGFNAVWASDMNDYVARTVEVVDVCYNNEKGVLIRVEDSDGWCFPPAVLELVQKTSFPDIMGHSVSYDPASGAINVGCQTYTVDQLEMVLSKF